MGYYKLICILIVGFCLTVRTNHHWHCNNNIILKNVDIVSFAARSRVAVWIYKKVSPLLLVNNSTHLCATLPARRPCCCSVKLCERYPLCCWPSKLLLSTATPFPPTLPTALYRLILYLPTHSLRNIDRSNHIIEVLLLMYIQHKYRIFYFFERLFCNVASENGPFSVGHHLLFMAASQLLIGNDLGRSVHHLHDLNTYS